RRIGRAPAMLSRERTGGIGFLMGWNRTEYSHQPGSDSTRLGERPGDTDGRESRHVSRSGGKCALAAVAHTGGQTDAQRRDATTLHFARNRDEHPAIDGKERHERSVIKNVADRGW